MAEFIYNNTKNASTGHISFELNCNYYFYVFFDNEINLYLKSCSTDKLVKELRKLILISQQNLFYAQKL